MSEQPNLNPEQQSTTEFQDGTQIDLHIHDPRLLSIRAARALVHTTEIDRIAEAELPPVTPQQIIGLLGRNLSKVRINARGESDQDIVLEPIPREKTRDDFAQAA